MRAAILSLIGILGICFTCTSFAAPNNTPSGRVDANLNQATQAVKGSQVAMAEHSTLLGIPAGSKIEAADSNSSWSLSRIMMMGSKIPVLIVLSLFSIIAIYMRQAVVE